MVSVHWAATQLQGNSDAYPTLCTNERGFAVVHVLFSVIVLSLFVSKLTSILQNMEQHRQRLHRVERQAKIYLEDARISMDVSLRVRKYIQWKERVNGHMADGMTEKELVSMLPVDLRREVLEEARAPLLDRSPVLTAIHGLSVPLYSTLCADIFEIQMHKPGETFFWYGKICKYMYFVTAG
eukprot:CAMPEP_0170331596 /NCGR_PEP_ID=MMETSP0116_2-20130129/66781_1 /TAXON_ID=400756 /ORGANISM="Durinskia baltica, Strain CSIRO CS-38" /LENGTH=181 /DNA_ID=CAMNT_0010584865 /DNA_START=147 /DNA_END=689 /DNA_ORIENTATION=+